MRKRRRDRSTAGRVLTRSSTHAPRWNSPRTASSVPSTFRCSTTRATCHRRHDLQAALGLRGSRRLGGAMVAENIARHLQARSRTSESGARSSTVGGAGSAAAHSSPGWCACSPMPASLRGATRPSAITSSPNLERLARPRCRSRSSAGRQAAPRRGCWRRCRSSARRGWTWSDLAAHKGSVLGALPDRMQPAQKAFETAICMQLQRFDPQRDRCSSRPKAARRHKALVPEGLILAMRRSNCVAIDATREARLEIPRATMRISRRRPRPVAAQHRPSCRPA